MKIKLNLIILLFVYHVSAQDLNVISKDIAINSIIDGTLLTSGNETHLAIIIAGSGPIDRNGNQNFLKNNSLKKLAEGLTNNGIATFRYDKRTVKQIRKGRLDNNILFDDFVTDAIAVVDYFKTQNSYSKIYIIGHSQGSLVGLLAAKDNIDGFISLAGAGQSFDTMILEQIENMDQSLVEPTEATFKSLRAGQTTTNYPVALASIFNIDIQPFIMNWMQYDPIEIIKDLQIPILIINGTKDLQVSVAEAERLNEASKTSQLKLIENMNHVLFIIEGDDLENSKSYNESFRPIANELIQSVTSFIKS